MPGSVTEGALVRFPDLFEAPLPRDPMRFRLSDVAVQKELSGLIDRLAGAGDLQDAAGGRAALGHVILLSALVERERARGTAERGDDEDADLGAAFADAVETALEDGVDPGALAASLNTEIDTLDASLTRVCGMTSADYVTARAMHEARRRLADTDDSDHAIARGLGFASPAQFVAAFARAAGQQPEAFRLMERRATGSGQSR